MLYEKAGYAPRGANMSLMRRIDDLTWNTGMLARALVERLETGISFNPMRPDLRVDPYPFYKALRERDPFHRSRPADGWVLSRYEDVLAVLGDKTFSSDERHQRRWKRFAKRRRRAGLPEPYDEDRASMLRLDPPDHTRLRTLVNKGFTVRRVEGLRGRIEGVIDELLHPLAGASRMEFVREFGSPLPVVVIAEMLGVPGEDFERFHHWSNEVVRSLGDGTLEDARRSEVAMTELGDYFEGICEQRRAEPREDLITALVQAEEQGQKLNRMELFTTLVLLLVAGNETTTKLIGNALVALHRNPEQLEILRDEPKRIAGAVDELLRYDGVVQLTSRMVVEDREFRGHALKKGQQLLLLLASANRDPAQFDEPDRLDVTREDVRHLGFSYGLHYCLGAQLARLEAGLALEALIGRWPHLAVEEAGIEWSDNTILRGPVKLPLVLR